MVMVSYSMDYLCNHWSFFYFELSYRKIIFSRKIKHQQFLTNFIPIMFIISIIGVMQNWMFQNLDAYKEYSSRTKSEFFQKEKLSYLTILDFLDSTSE